MSKMMAKCSQDMRDALSVLMTNLIGPQEHGLIDAAREQGLAYNQRVQKKGHGLGSPHVWIYGGVVEWLVANLDPDTPEPQAKALKAHLAEFAELEPDEKAEVCKFFKVSKTFKSDFARITLALDNRATEIRSILIKQLEHHNFIIKTGRAPASYMERELQSWIESMDPK